MVDGDQLNVVVDPLFVSIAERNLKKYDVIPLFYDANKAAPEQLSLNSMFGGLKRAHDYSSGGITSIGEISNMLTRLWNKENPDRIAAAWLTMFNNLVIDAAKSGILSHYKDFPSVAKRINKAVGGKTGRLPHWFQYSKNGRKKPATGKKKRQYLNPNNSTMNRICAAFNDIGNINLRTADVAPFNWQMLLSGPAGQMNQDACESFCAMDSINKTNIVESQELDYVSDREAKAGYDLLAMLIKEEMIEKYGPLEKTYPSIVKFLFTTPNLEKATHKQMFWRVYGHIALENLRSNLSTCTMCENCGMRIPSWAKNHLCSKTHKGFFECVECHKVFPRVGPRQCRCKACQEAVKTEQKTDQNKKYYNKKKAEKELAARLKTSRFQTRKE